MVEQYNYLFQLADLLYIVRLARKNDKQNLKPRDSNGGLTNFTRLGLVDFKIDL